MNHHIHFDVILSDYLVARGSKSTEKGKVLRDSPTASNAIQRLILQIIAQKQWIPHV